MLVFVTVEDVNPEGVRGGVGAPRGASGVFQTYPDGVPPSATASETAAQK